VYKERFSNNVAMGHVNFASNWSPCLGQHIDLHQARNTAHRVMLLDSCPQTPHLSVLLLDVLERGGRDASTIELMKPITSGYNV
jgi:hypothetical protein